MNDVRETIDYYHSLLDVSTARETHEQLAEQLRRRGLFFGERPLSSVLRPRFLHPRQYIALQGAIRITMPAFRKIYDAALTNADFRKQFGLYDWEEELITFDPGFDASPTGRMDTFFDESHALWLTEYNAETPAAVAYSDVLSEVYFALPVMREFIKHYEVAPLPARHQMFHVLMDCYQKWGGQATPRVAILDWREVPTYSEFVLFNDYFRSQGLDSVIADPRDMTYEHGVLRTGEGQPINIIYKRVLLSELVDRGGLDHPVIRAVRDRAACMVNPFRCKILHKKASLAVMSDETNAHLFTYEERQAIDRHIPWTRVVSERHTTYYGLHVDLIPFLQKHKDEFVLKPNDEYGGKGIVLGWEADNATWEAGLQTALKEPYIAQKRVALPKFPYASWVNDHIEVYDRMLDTNPYIWYGAYADGCLTRLSTMSLLNVTAGGGSTVPTFIAAKRE
jgi:hypothetical protein